VLRTALSAGVVSLHASNASLVVIHETSTTSKATWSEISVLRSGVDAAHSFKKIKRVL
jgi:hypothetical protein